MPTQTGSIDFASTGGFKSYATNKYATQSTVSQMQTAISQNATDIALRATKTEASQMAQPNLAPLGSADFASVYDATTNPKGYWKTTIGPWFTRLDDGWIHVYVDNTAGTAAVNSTSFRPSPSPSVVPSGVYTILTEIRKNASTGNDPADMYIQQIANNQFWGNVSDVVIDDEHVTTSTQIPLNTCGTTYVMRSYRIADTTHLTDGVPPSELFRYNFRCAVGAKLDFDFRMSLYDGIYDGPYKPYSGTQLYASQAELKVQADRIGMVVSNNDASSSLALTADAMEYIGGHVVIKGTDGTSTVISGGKIQANSIGANEINATSINASNSLTVGAMTAATQADILNGNMQVGGRNLLRHTGSPVASDLVLTRASVANGVITVTPTTSAGYAKFRVDYLDFDEYGEGEYTVSFDAKAVSGATYTQLKGPIVYAGFQPSSRIGNVIATSADRYVGYTLETLTYEWVRYSKTFTAPDSMTTGQASALASGSNLTIEFAMSGSYAPMQVRNVKLEKGNKATDWTAAPEDVESSIVEASKTASNYITADSTGIKIHMSGSTSTYQHQSSTATTYYVNGNKRAEVGADGLKVYVGTTGTESSVAEFGTTARLGLESGYHTEVTSTGMSVSDGTDDVVRIHSEVTQDGVRYGSVDIGKSGDDTLTSVGGSAEDYTEDDYVYHKRSAELTAMASTDSDGAWVKAWSEHASTWTEDLTGIDLQGEHLNLYGDGGLVYGSVSMENAGKVISTQSGMVTQSISASANAVTTHTVTFPNSYDSAPIVVACFYSTSSAAAFGGLSLAVSAITTTSFTVKIFNNTSTGRSPGLFWIATPQTSQT